MVEWWITLLEDDKMTVEQNRTSVPEPEDLSQIIKIDEAKVSSHLGDLVRRTVEETLNGMLDAEAQEMCQAGRYERSEARQNSRAGFYPRKLQTQAGEVKLNVPKLRQAKFETAIIERYRRRETSIEEALMEMYLAGVSVRRVEDITEALWGMRVSAGTVSDLNQKLYDRIEQWRNEPIVGVHPYVYLDGICLKRSWAGEIRNVSVLVAVGVGAEGFREILGVAEGPKEDAESWRQFLTYLKRRGLTGVELIISDKCLGLVEAATEFYPEARWQRCVVHWYRNIFSDVPSTKVREVAAMLKAIHAQEDADAAQEKAMAVVEKLKALKLKKAAEKVAESVGETLTYYQFPAEHHRQIRTNNMLERIMREIRRRTRVVGAFPDGRSALMLAAARLRYVSGSRWGTRRYLDMNRLTEMQTTEAARTDNAAA
jgi:transposase-like protein